ncbi:MAG: hypothetical protein OXD43_02065 [Bacteroidetes bacterium]|nr:hypothetical protein [Bacteroidota bacterium]
MGEVIGWYKVAKHFTLEIKEEHFAYTRDEDAIGKEARRDGIYAVRTSFEANAGSG